MLFSYVVQLRCTQAVHVYARHSYEIPSQAGLWYTIFSAHRYAVHWYAVHKDAVQMLYTDMLYTNVLYTVTLSQLC